MLLCSTFDMNSMLSQNKPMRVHERLAPTNKRVTFFERESYGAPLKGSWPRVETKVIREERVILQDAAATDLRHPKARAHSFGDKSRHSIGQG